MSKNEVHSVEKTPSELIDKLTNLIDLKRLRNVSIRVLYFKYFRFTLFRRLDSNPTVSSTIYRQSEV